MERGEEKEGNGGGERGHVKRGEGKVRRGEGKWKGRRKREGNNHLRAIPRASHRSDNSWDSTDGGSILWQAHYKQKSAIEAAKHAASDKMFRTPGQRLSSCLLSFSFPILVVFIGARKDLMYRTKSFKLLFSPDP